jgi:hypothetical protein
MPRLRNRHHAVDPLWHVQIVIVMLIVFQVGLPQDLLPLPSSVPLQRFLAPAVEAVAIVVLQIFTPNTAVFDSARRRIVVAMLIALIAIDNVLAMLLLIDGLSHTHAPNPGHLLLSALNVYGTTIVVFALLYWEMDGGGPGQRRSQREIDPDFQFPQQTDPHSRWNPTFIDYLYVAVTNMTAFSPTDTLPLSRRAKMLMTAQSFIAIAVVALVAARAINHL